MLSVVADDTLYIPQNLTIIVARHLRGVRLMIFVFV
jgi:hypothetical protein